MFNDLTKNDPFYVCVFFGPCQGADLSRLSTCETPGYQSAKLRVWKTVCASVFLFNDQYIRKKKNGMMR